MGGKGGGSSPDYKGAAEAEAKASREITEQQTWANRPTQYNPWGQVSWDVETVYDPATEQNINKWTQYEQLSPELQRALDSQIALQTGRSDIAGGMLGRVAGEFQDPMDWQKFGPMTGVEPLDLMQDPSMWNQQAGDAIIEQARRRLDPQFEQEREQLEIKLRNQGLRPGDQAWDAEIGSFDMRKTDAYQNAINNARIASGQEAQRMQGMEKTGLGYNEDALFRQAEFSNQLRQQAIKEEMTKRGFSLNEINALLTGQQVANPSFESFQGATKSDTPQYMQAAVNQGNFDQAQSQGMMSGITGLMGAGAQMYGAGMFSDRRLKKNIKRIGTLCGFPFYSFTYLWGEKSKGVMSDEIPRSCVSTVFGFDFVDYEKLGACHA